MKKFVIFFFFAAVVQCEDLKLKYYEEMAKRKKLHNIVEETKGASSDLLCIMMLSLSTMNVGRHVLPTVSHVLALC
jgi:hypothetical protein